MNEELELTKLTIEDLDNVIALQQRVIDNLPQEQKHFTIHRTKEDFEKVLKSKSQVMYGVYIGKSLVAQSIVSFPHDNEVRELSDVAQGYKNSDIAVYKAVVVDPRYQGRGLMRRMLQAREDLAVMCDKKVAICKISFDNHFSWENALKHGMQITRVQKEGKHIKMYLQKELNSRHNGAKLYSKNMISMNVDKVQKYGKAAAMQFMMMTSIGKVGVWDSNMSSVLWMDNPKYNNNTKKTGFFNHVQLVAHNR